MNKLVLAAALILTATAAASAQQGYIGSAIADVYRNPASGCGYGLGYSGPGCPNTSYYSDERYGYYRYGPGYDYRQGIGRDEPKQAPRSARSPASPTQ